MEAFEIKTRKSDYPILVIADSLSKAMDIIYHEKGINELDLISISHLVEYSGNNILLQDKSEIEEKVRYKILDTMPRWKQMLDGCARCEHYAYLVRHSEGNYSLSTCIGGREYYLELKELEQLDGIKED